MLQDYKLGLRMLLKYPGLTLAGGLALAIAIGIGAGWYDLIGKVIAPTIPLPEGGRLVLIETRNTLTNESEPRLVHDFLEWRRELRTIEDLGAYRTDIRNLVVGNGAPDPIQVAELTAVAFGTARVPPILGRGLLDSDEMAGAPDVVVVGYDVWQRSGVWLLLNALALHCKELTLVALWDTGSGSGHGGTDEMVALVTDNGHKLLRLPAEELKALC